MAWNTKGADTRITEIYTTINTECATLAHTATLVLQLRAAIALLSNAQKNTLSDSLHIGDKTNSTKRQRNCIRARGFIEQLLVDPMNRRSPTLCKNDGYAEPQAAKCLKELIKLLDPNPLDSMQDPRCFRPLRIGAGIGAVDREGPGSITCFVRCRATGDVMLMSNEHVLQQGRLTVIGDLKQTPNIIQPALRLGGSPTQVVAAYVRGGLNANYDAGVARLTNGIGYANTTPENVALAGTSAVLTAGLSVWKRGSRTRITRGRIIDNNRNATIGHNQVGNINFVGQIEVRAVNDLPFQMPGDSGAALLNDANELIGILHGGTEIGNTALATPINTVLDALNVDLI